MPRLRVVAPLPVTQREIEALIGISNQIESLHRLYNQQAGEVFRRLDAGAVVETGVHVAEIQERNDGPSCTRTLVIR